MTTSSINKTYSLFDKLQSDFSKIINIENSIPSISTETSNQIQTFKDTIIETCKSKDRNICHSTILDVIKQVCPPDQTSNIKFSNYGNADIKVDDKVNPIVNNVITFCFEDMELPFVKKNQSNLILHHSIYSKPSNDIKYIDDMRHIFETPSIGNIGMGVVNLNPTGIDISDIDIPFVYMILANTPTANIKINKPCLITFIYCNISHLTIEYVLNDTIYPTLSSPAMAVSSSSIYTRIVITLIIIFIIVYLIRLYYNKKN